MKLHELQPATGSQSPQPCWSVVLHLVMVKLLAVVKRSKVVAVAVYVLVLKVDKLHCSVVFKTWIYKHQR